MVSTAELGTRDVLRVGLGVHIAQEDVADFAGKLATVLGDAALSSALGGAGREYAQTWSASRQAQLMLALYRAAQGACGRLDNAGTGSGVHVTAGRTPIEVPPRLP